MGSKHSKILSRRQFSDYGSASSSWDQYGYPQSPYPQQSPYYSSTPQHQYAPSPSFGIGNPQKNLDRRYSRIADNYRSLDEVTSALAQAGLESSNLIVGVDFTKSNEWTGSRSFKRRSLHHIGNVQNPYEQAISIIGRTLSTFDEDNLIPCFGFGDASTHDQDVFSFYPDERFCNGFEEVLTRYRGIVPNLKLSGPTSFAPIIEMAMTIVEQSGGQYHVLLIIADGQVTRSVDTQQGHLSPQEQKTIDAIVKASEYPLSIILVGVGDGPFDTMKEFDDNIPERAFDNFQFVNFTEIMSKNVDPFRKETEFSLAALMEIPSQYKATIELGLLGSRQTGNAPDRIPLPPPIYDIVPSHSSTRPYHSTSFQQSAPPYTAYDPGVRTSPSTSSFYDNQVCPICLTNPKDLAFGCGHQTCFDCGEALELCPICRSSIHTRIKLY
ncbi:E3 ubiquitin-protein ligase RGLG5 isoform X2 [Ziziphus jujuba]|uniref:E3 ubiquitin-protein ligase RGLG5 isoform X2 n=1 Tax=Ziziphus jujuba TaxID=326968 RepID=A0A6P4AI60_ZIZJJ|nr:E3 ubiquitin-protein ligase RGLG5 isoform X2 [Ziziphus jujuba]